MSSILNLSAGVYEAIILAVLAVAVYAVFALRSKAKEATTLKGAAVKLAEAGTRAILGLTFAITVEQQKRRRAERAAAEAEQALMEAHADIDDANDNREAGRPNLDRLFGMLDPRWRGRVNPIDALLFGGPGPNHPTVRGRPFDINTLLADHGLRGTVRGNVKAFKIGSDGTLVPVGGAVGPGFPFSLEDLHAALHGDMTGIERALGAPPGTVHLDLLDGSGGRELTGLDREAAVADIAASIEREPGFGQVDVDIDQAALDGAADGHRAFHSGGGSADPLADPLADHLKATLTPAEPTGSAKWTGHGQDGQAPVLTVEDQPERPRHGNGYQNPRAG